MSNEANGAMVGTYVQRQMRAKLVEYGEWVRVSPEIVTNTDALDAVADRFAHSVVNTFGWRMAIPVVELANQRFPRDWWESVKERFAPGWFLRRWPVVYSQVRVEEFIDAVVPPGKGVDVHFNVTGPRMRLPRSGVGYCALCDGPVPVYMGKDGPRLNMVL